MNIISQKDELKRLLIPKVSEFGLDDGTVEEILSVARDFSENELKPNSLEWDEKGTHLDESITGKKKLIFPEHFVETQKKLAKTGLFGLCIPEEYGGFGLPYTLYS